MNPSPRLSVVLPVGRNVPAHRLEACLRSLERQTLPAAMYEIVLAGDGALRPPALGCAVRSVPSDPPCPPARACNLGVQAASSETVLFLRPDVAVDPDCLRQHVEIHASVPEAEYGVLGRLDLPPGNTAWRRILTVSGRFSTPRGLTNAALYGHEHFCQRNLSLPRRSVVAAGLFDERFQEDGWGLEAQELGVRLAQVPVKAVHARTCIATMQYLPGLEDFLDASRQCGADLARMHGRHAALRGGPHFSVADLHFWRHFPTRLTTRLNDLKARLRSLEDRAADPAEPALPNTAEIRARLAALGRLRTREILALLDSLESALDRSLYEDAALPAVLFLDRLHELSGYFATEAAAELCPQERGRLEPGPQERADVAAPAARGRVLLATNYFWPSVGGTELLVEELGLRLMGAGFSVEVACRHMDARTVFRRKGMRIHAFRCAGAVNSPEGPDIGRYRRLICSGRHDAVIVLSHPDTWCCSLLRGLPAQGRPRIIMMPSMNADNLATWRSSGDLESIHDVLRAADAHITVSEQGFDAKVLDDLELPFTFLPHAVTAEAAPVSMRQRLGLSPDVPLLACVGNFWPVKNQLELLKVMSASPGDWKLILAGGAAPWPDKRPYFMACWEIASRDPRIHHAGPLQPLDAAALIRDADMLLLPSKGESAGPLVVLQAMAAGTPWIATPECNAVHDEAGGLIVDLGLFPRAVEALLDNPDAARELAALGQEHWRRCFTWEQSLQGFVDLIEGRAPSADLRMPRDLRQRWQSLTRSITADLQPIAGIRA